MVPTSSLSPPHHPHHPHIIPIISHHLHIVSTPPWLWSPCCLRGLHSILSPRGPCHPCHPHCPCHPHIILLVPMSSLHHLEGPHIIPNPQINTTPTRTPQRGAPELVKFQFSRFELIEIFQFCLKIWSLWRLPHLWLGAWVGGWMGGLMGGVRSNH